MRKVPRFPISAGVLVRFLFIFLYFYIFPHGLMDLIVWASQVVILAQE